MIDLGPHAGFIVSAYLGVALALAGLIGAAFFGARRSRVRLAELEALAGRQDGAPR
jgi:heme exporter protein D